MEICEKTLKPMKEMLVRNGVDIERCWNGNETLICLAAQNCLACPKQARCEFVPKEQCPNYYLFGNLKHRLLH